MDINALRANYRPIDLGQGEAQQPQKKKKNFWLDQLSTVGGIAGGIGGSFIAPVAGTVGGAAVGSGLGQAIENLITGDRTMDNVGKEAALGGIFGGGPLKLAGVGGRALLGAGAKTATKEGAQLLTGTALKNAAKKTAGSNPLIREGKQLYRATLGVDDILTPNKVKPLTIFKSDELVNEAVKSGLRGSPQLMQREAGVLFKDVGSQVSDVLKGITKTAPIKGKDGLFTLAKKQVAKDLPLRVDGVAASSEINRIGNEMAEFATKGQLTGLGLHEFKKRLSSRISPAFTKIANGQDLTMKELVDMSFWKESDNLISKLAPAAKDLTRKQSRLYGLANGLATQTRSLGPPNRLFEVGQRMLARPVGATQNAIGRGMMRAGGEGVESGTRQLGFGSKAIQNQSTLRGFGGVTNRGIAGRELAQGGLRGLGGQTPPAQDQPTSLEDALLQTDQAGAGSGQAPQEQSPYTRENLMADIQRDPKNAKDYISYYGSLQEIFASPTQPKLSSAASGVIADTETGLQSLQGLSQNIGQSGANSPVIGQLRGLNPFDTEAQSLQANIATAKQIVGKALEGGVLRKEDEYKYAKILPKLGDTDAVAQYKIQQLVDLISSRLSTYKRNIGGDTTLQDAVMSAQGGYQ